MDVPSLLERYITILFIPVIGLAIDVRLVSPMIPAKRCYLTVLRQLLKPWRVLLVMKSLAIPLGVKRLPVVTMMPL